MKRVAKAYFEVRDDELGGIYASRTVWSTKEANKVKCRPGHHIIPSQPNEPWHYETKNFDEALIFFTNHPPKDTIFNPFLEKFSPDEFRFMDVRGEVDHPQSCTVILSGGRTENFAF